MSMGTMLPGVGEHTPTKLFCPDKLLYFHLKMLSPPTIVPTFPKIPPST
jgi:hypothetical protein